MGKGNTSPFQEGKHSTKRVNLPTFGKRFSFSNVTNTYIFWQMFLKSTLYYYYMLLLEQILANGCCVNGKLNENMMDWNSNSDIYGTRNKVY